MKKILLILADGFEEIEAVGTADILRRMKFEVTLAGLNGRQVTASHGTRVMADALLDEADPAEFAALVLPGGMPGAINLYNDSRVEALLREFHRQGKVTAAICAAPMVLDKAGLLDHRRFTMYPDEALFRYLKPGHRPQPDMAVTDGMVITGKGPGATPVFAAAIAAALGAPDTLIRGHIAGMFF